MLNRIGTITAAIVIVAAGFAIAAEDLGVKIYPGAKKDEQWSRAQAEILKATGGGAGVCYLTTDAVPKVAAFYQAEGFKLSFGQVTADGAMLQKGDKLSMSLKNMKTVDNTNNTKICIGKK